MSEQETNREAPVFAGLRSSYERAAQRIGQVTDDQLLHITVDVMSAATLVMGGMKSVRKHRPLLVRLLNEQELADVDALETYADALVYVQTRFHFATNPPEILPELVQRAISVRDVLVSNVVALSKHGLINGAVLEDLKGTKGHKNLAVDLAGMASVLREHWEGVSKGTFLTLAYIEAADVLAKELLMAIAQREEVMFSADALREERARAFTLVATVWEMVRDAMAWLRRTHRDEDGLVPSFYNARAATRRKRARASKAAELAATAATATTTNGAAKKEDDAAEE